jgi:RNA polymerase sigma-70 factor (ECF subfamily)
MKCKNRIVSNLSPESPPKAAALTSMTSTRRMAAAGVTRSFAQARAAGMARGVPSDDEVIHGLAQADTRAFDRAYDGLRARLYSFLLRLSGRVDLAEDLLQETWLRLVRSAPELPEGTRLRPWLFTVARNLFRSHRRSSRRDLQRSSELAGLPGLSSESPFESLAAASAERALDRAMARLSVDQREVLLLCVYGFEPADAGPMLGITAEATRQRLSRARVKLRRLLERDTRGGVVEAAALLALGITFVARTFHETVALFW